MNFNTFAGYIGGTLRNQISPQVLATATNTEFHINTDVSSTTIALLTLPSGSSIAGSVSPLDINTNAATIYQSGRQAIPLGAPRPSHSAATFDVCRPFLIRLCGNYTPLTGATSTSIAFNLYLGTSKSGTNIASTGSVTNGDTAGGTYGFIIEALLKWDSTSQATRGQQWYDVASNSTNSVYNTWKATSAGSGTTLANMSFCAATTWGAPNGGTVNVGECSISQF